MGCARIDAVTNTARILLCAYFTVKLEMDFVIFLDFVIFAADYVVDGFQPINHGFSGEFHPQFLDHAKRSGVGRIGAGVDILSPQILETVSQNRSGGLRRNSLPPMQRRDAVKDFNFARGAAVFSEMSQSAEA